MIHKYIANCHTQMFFNNWVCLDPLHKLSDLLFLHLQWAFEARLFAWLPAKILHLKFKSCKSSFKKNIECFHIVYINFQCHASRNVFSDETNVSLQRKKWDLRHKDSVFYVKISIVFSSTPTRTYFGKLIFVSLLETSQNNSHRNAIVDLI